MNLTKALGPAALEYSHFLYMPPLCTPIQSNWLTILLQVRVSKLLFAAVLNCCLPYTVAAARLLKTVVCCLELLFAFQLLSVSYD